MPGQLTTRKTALRCVGGAAAVFIALAAFDPARAEMSAGQHKLTATPIPAATTVAPLTVPALATAAPGEPAGIACRAPAGLARLERPLQRTARRLAAGQPLVIVAIGSSSTAGAGASSPAASYPSRLAAELQTLLHRHDITVLNRGVNGEETPNMMARFASGVIAEHPQLVLWQVGTNSVLRDHPLKPHAVELRQGIEQLKEAGADVVLIDPQYAPRVLAKSETPDMVDLIALAARDENVDLFRRFAIMRHWYENQHRSFDVFISRDGLHMNDWGYACWARLLAAGIAEAASSPVASAAGPHAR
jgi:acyl-CoA thioesterase I